MTDSPGGLQLASYSAPRPFPLPQEAQSDLGDDSSSSLSDIENAADNDLDDSESDLADQDNNDDHEGDEDEDDQDDLEDEDEDEPYSQQGREPGSDFNDSEAETERLENSPHLARRHKDVLLNSKAISRTFERSPSKLFQAHNIHQDVVDSSEEDEEDADADEDEDEDNDTSAKAIKSQIYSRASRLSSSIMRGAEVDELAMTGLQQDSSFNKKRKRSLLPDRRLSYHDDDDEPANKRPARHVDDFAIDDIPSDNEDNGASNTISAQRSDTSSIADDEEELKDKEMADGATLKQSEPEELGHAGDASIQKLESHRPKSRKSLGAEDSVDVGQTETMDIDTIDATQTPLVAAQHAEDEVEDEIEEDEAEIALRNEAEQEKRRKSLEMLAEIQRSFDKFRNTLYTERMAILEQEEAMLKAKVPTHPQYLEMVKCIDARHDNKLEIEKKLMKFKQEAIQRTAVATRAQILSQFHQEVRDIRERKLEQCGHQWYDIQSDRRSFGSQPERYAFPFPTKKSTQIMHHNQYTKEISLLSSIAKNVGFPAAPSMNSATQEELESDLEKMGQNLRRKQVSHRPQQALPNLAALRAATSESSLKPAEERFIEQNAWANPQHPSNAHLIQRQMNAHHVAPRNGIHVPVGGVRRQPHHHVQPQPHHHHHHHHHHQMPNAPTLALFSSPHVNSTTSASNGEKAQNGNSYDHSQQFKTRTALPFNNMDSRQATKTPEIPRQNHTTASVPARKPLPVAPVHTNIEVSGIKRE